MGDVVACAFELVEKVGDLVKHEVNGARDLVDAIVAGEWQARIEIAVHDLDDRVLNALKSLRGAMRKPNADRQDQERRREECDRESPEQSLL